MASSCSPARRLWSERETAALIDCWQDHLNDLRRQKRNAAVYAEIAEALRILGFHRTSAEVRHKIRNLTQMYRDFNKNGTTTGSGAIQWPHYARIHSFLGSLPMNDPSLVQETRCSGGATVEEIILGMVVGADTGTAEDGSPALENWQEPALNADDSRAGGFAAESAAIEDGGAEGQAGIREQQNNRKRLRTASSDFRQALLTEQRMLRESLEACHSREMEMRQRHLTLQEKMVNAITKFFESS
ncbi:uncharacterized protein LOC144103232 [Amblyomma americanum]